MGIIENLIGKKINKDAGMASQQGVEKTFIYQYFKLEHIQF